MPTITDLTARVSELLGIEVSEETVRRHRISPYHDHYEGSPSMERLLRDVWEEETGGAQWPWTSGLYEDDVVAGVPCRGLTDAGVAEAERRGLDVDVDAYGMAFARDPETREVVDLTDGGAS